MGKCVNFRIWFVLFTIAISALLNAQQGGAGGGFGGGGGSTLTGGQGMNFGDEEESYPPREPEIPIWNSRSMILTQGDRVEWKFKGVPGQTLLATVRSDVFDPALKLVDSKDKVLAENDDQYEGNQSPFLMFQFPDDGEYKLLVQNYHATAGGRFMLYTQTFKPVEIGVGANVKPVEPAEKGIGHGGNRIYLHFKATEGKTYSIRSVGVKPFSRFDTLSFRMILGPTGVKSMDYNAYDHRGGVSPLFEAKKTGDYYLLYESPDINGTLSARLDVVEVSKVDKLAPFKFDLIPNGQRIFKFDVEKGDIVRSKIDAPDEVNLFYLAQAPPNDLGKVRPRYSIREFLPLYTDDNDIYRMYLQKSEVTLVVSSESTKPSSVSITNAMDIPTWTDAKPISGKLALGETQFYIVNGTKGDIQRLKGKAEGFELQFSLTDMDGEITSFIDQKTHMPKTELQYEENKRYLARITSPQGGGSGTYSMSLEVAKPLGIALGKSIVYQDGPSLGTYAIEVEAGQRYQLLQNGEARAYSLIDEKGDTIQSFEMTFGKLRTVYFTPEKKGVVRIKVYGGNKDTRFRVDKHVLPDLGG